MRRHPGTQSRLAGPHRTLRWLACRGAVFAAALVVSPLFVSSASSAAPARPAALAAGLAAGGQPTLTQLEARAARLARQYRGQLVRLDDAQDSARAATARAGRLRHQLGVARRYLGQVAVARYLDGEADPALAVLFSGGDPQHMLSKSAVVTYLARQRSDKLAQLRALTAASQRAGQAASARVAELRHLVTALAGQRRAVAQLMARFRPQSPVIGGDGVTARMREVRDQADRHFGPFPAIGCYRPESSGEHPLGRACDFMLSSGGVMPTASRVSLGYALAAWAQQNASRLGIMYIIYRQRIWDIRMASSGWVPMEDRGSITANHFDHVHISVF
ncbi:MAG TPA: hypothetical protein VFV41_21690 [Streptosporangiaceae bacterium]|nr:hypothetical protein [Streptosporangiaceae bacterium]